MTAPTDYSFFVNQQYRVHPVEIGSKGNIPILSNLTLYGWFTLHSPLADIRFIRVFRVKTISNQSSLISNH